MSASSIGIEKARKLVAARWSALSIIARLVCAQWPWRNSPGHIAAAQFSLEVERARRTSEEKGGERWTH